MASQYTAAVYGDSIMRATVPDENFRYHFASQLYFEQLEQETGASLLNRAHFGATVGKGQKVLQRDLEKGLTAQYTLLEFGGNDCDFDWAAIAAHPEQEHLPRTQRESFRQALGQMIRQIRSAGSTPVLMTLPPIDAGRYLRFICRDGLDRERILQWLGDVEMIYRYQELYSDTVAQLAAEQGLLCVDVRSVFLQRHDLQALISQDGIHLSPAGYALLFRQFLPLLKKAPETQAS